MNRTLKKALANTQVPLIIAHQSRKITDVLLRRYKDEKAGTSLLINATVQPFSPITGNKLVPEVERTIRVSAADIKDLVPFAENKEGGFVYRTTSEIAAVLNAEGKGSKVFCTVTSSEIPVKINQQVLAAAVAADAALDDEEDPNGDGMADPTDADFDNTGEDDDSGFQADEDFATGETGDMDSTGDAGIGEEDAAVPPHAEPDGDEDAGLPSDGDADNAAVNGLSDADFNVGGDDTGVDAGTGDVPGAGDAAMGDDSMPGNDTLTGDAAEQDALTDIDSINNHQQNDTSLASYRVDLLEETASTKETEFHLILAGDEGKEVYYVMANHQPVAVAQKSSATDGVKKIFLNTAKFAHAFHDAVATDGLTSEVMADFGIEPIRIEINANAVMASQIETAKKEEAAKFEAKANDLRDVMSQSISIAAMALNKGFFKDTPNPLRAGLCEVLAANNVRNPERLVDSVFEKHGEDYHRLMLEHASKLSNDSDETRNSVAKLVEEASYQPIARATVGDRVIDRVVNGNTAKSTVTASIVEETASVRPAAIGDDVTQLRQKLGLGNKRRAF